MTRADDYLLLSGIQHFSFCRRQWALIHIEQLWNENYLTASGRAEYQRVHDAEISDMRNGILTVRDLPVKSDRLRITGACDAVEFIPSESGVRLSKRDGLWRVYPVEYKHGSSKASDCDRLQLAAQAICLEEMFCTNITEGAIFYYKTRRREKVAITDELRVKVKAMFAEMNELYSRGYTPRVKPGSECRSCSMVDLCLPVLMKAKIPQSVSTYIDNIIDGE